MCHPASSPHPVLLPQGEKERCCKRERACSPRASLRGRGLGWGVLTFRLGVSILVEAGSSTDPPSFFEAIGDCDEREGPRKKFSAKATRSWRATRSIPAAPKSGIRASGRTMDKAPVTVAIVSSRIRLEARLELQTLSRSAAAASRPGDKRPPRPETGANVEQSGKARWTDISGQLTGAGHVLPVRVYFEDTDFSGLVSTPPISAGASAGAPTISAPAWHPSHRARRRFFLG